jgi:hypothetical protein
LPPLLVAAISEYNKKFDLAKASRPLARVIAAQRTFRYARHDPRSRTLKPLRRRVVTPEIYAYAGALVLCGWVGWVHEAKGIWHFNETSVSGEVFLNHEFLPSIMRAVAVGRSKALLEKITEGHYQPEFRVDEARSILEKALGIGP